MFRNTRERMRRVFRRGVRRALRIIRMGTPPPIEQLPVVITEPFREHNLIKLLRPSSPDITLLNEDTVFDTDPTVYPHKYFLRLQLVETVRGQRTYKTLEVVAKVLGLIPRSNLQKENIRLKMEQEITMWTNVLRTFDQYQMTWIFADHKYSDLFPVCYGCAFSLENDHAGTADHSAAILLQNLNPLGFVKFREPCSYEVAKLIIKRLALFHATPIAMQIHVGNRYLSRRQNTRNRNLEPRDVREELRRICLVITPDSEMYRYIGVVNYHLDRYARHVHGDYVPEVRPWITVSHSRCSLHNIMYKPPDHNGPANVKFLDPGYMELDSCASDLLFFMLTSMTLEVIENYFDDLVSTYYTEFSRCMSLAYIDHEEYSYEKFITEFEQRAVCNIGAILFEIGRLHFDNIEGFNVMMGMSYRAKIDYVINFMVRKTWIEI